MHDGPELEERRREDDGCPPEADVAVRDECRPDGRAVRDHQVGGVITQMAREGSGPRLLYQCGMVLA